MLFIPECPRQPKFPMKLAHKPEIIADIAVLMSDEIAYLEEVNVIRYVQNLTSSRKLAERAASFQNISGAGDTSICTLVFHAASL